MNVCETSIRDLESPYWGDDVLEDLGTLAANALPCPVCDIGSDVWPYKFGCDRLSRSGHAWVPQAVDDIKNLAAHRGWYKRASWTVGDVDEQVVVVHFDLFEVQSRLRVSCNSLELWIQDL